MSAKIEDFARRRAEREKHRPKAEPAGPEAAGGAAKGALCPICGRPRDHAHRPFCSKRCADIDLGRWLKESYRVQTDESPETTANRPEDETD
jgi:endogenous inhibitor of DNA gyrase (YacG/DUF329 family)